MSTTLILRCTYSCCSIDGGFSFAQILYKSSRRRPVPIYDAYSCVYIYIYIYMYIPYTHSVPDDNNIINLIDSTGWFYFFTFFKYISRLWVREKNPKRYLSPPRFYCEYTCIYVCVRRTYTAHIK